MKYVSLSRVRHALLYADTPPKLTAASMAVGVALAFSPFPGVHLVAAFLLSKIFRLNPVVVLIGSMIHNPWTMLPIHAFGLMVGDLMLYGHLESVELFRAFPWDELGVATVFKLSFWSQNGDVFLEMLRPFFIGSFAVSAILGLFAYRLTLKFVKYAKPALIRAAKLKKNKARSQA